MNNKITKEFRDINCEIGKYIRANTNYCYNNLNPTQLHILFYLISNEDQDICQKQIEEEIHIKKASVTGSLDSLEEKGFIQRIVSDDDKRKKYIKVTQKVKDERKTIETVIHNLEKKLTEGISKKELDQLIKTVNRMKKNLED